ncbi:hypothetical protein LguiB_007415 [Lonicera macranthoides]
MEIIERFLWVKKMEQHHINLRFHWTSVNIRILSLSTLEDREEKAKKIRELSAELDSTNQRCEVYRANLLAVLRDMEDQKLKLSVKGLITEEREDIDPDAQPFLVLRRCRVLRVSPKLFSWRRDLKFVTDPKMEGNPESLKDAQGAAVDNDGDVKVTDKELEKGESSHPEDVQGQKQESSKSKDIEVESEKLPGSESGGFDKEELPHCEDGQVAVELPKDSCLVEDKCLVEPTVAESIVDGISSDIHGENRDTDSANLDTQNHSDSATPNENLLDKNAKEEKGEELDNGMKGTKEEELENGSTGMDSSPNIEFKEEELNNGATGSELLLANKTEEELNEGVTGMEILPYNEVADELLKPEVDAGHEVDVKTNSRSFLLEPDADFADEAGTEEEQVEFMKELETFHKERCLEFKPPKFYGEPLNCLKLWRSVVRLGGYEQVTSCKLWRQVGESFKPPNLLILVYVAGKWLIGVVLWFDWVIALLEYEKHKMRCGELPFTDVASTEPASAGNQACLNQASGSGRARRDAAARAMQGWHSQRLLGNGEVGDPIIKDKNPTSMPKREKQLKSIGLLKRKKPSPVERAVKVARMKASSPQLRYLVVYNCESTWYKLSKQYFALESHNCFCNRLETMVIDIGPPADWVKVNVQRTRDCFEVYALVPGLLREEVRVQSDPVGRLVISGQPEQLDNPWGVTPFKKVVSLPSRIDPHQTSAVVTLHGQLFVRVPFEQSDL